MNKIENGLCSHGADRKKSTKISKFVENISRMMS